MPLAAYQTKKSSVFKPLAAYGYNKELKRKGMAEYLVTGGAGFIGSHIVRTLVLRGEQVRVLDNFSTGKMENIREVEDSIELIRGDIRDENTAQRAVKGVSYVLHQGALPSVPRSFTDPVSTMQVNVLGTINILKHASRAAVKAVVIASSSSVYGNTQALPKKETDNPLPLSPYALSKLTAEHYAVYYARNNCLNTVILRYFNVFGPCQDPLSQYAAVIPRFIASALSGSDITIFGDGTQSRDFTYIDNVVEANIAACASHSGAGIVYNIACGKEHTVLSMAQYIVKALNSKSAIIYAPCREGDVLHSRADISRAISHLGYRCLVDFEEGLNRTIEWFSGQKT